jgi:hypothetical protein
MKSVKLLLVAIAQAEAFEPAQVIENKYQWINDYHRNDGTYVQGHWKWL